ncbi:gamma-mobile-trio protein GmtX [Herbaspirillum robiniae]|uniref:gamma-mobile-trio protein GmtX n=1 Tax=Herbaspirillum robiniae TaxID=2014887 RepID=UPI003D7707FF
MASNICPQDPDEVLENLLSWDHHPTRVKNLQKLHELCRILYERGERDFSLTTIASLAEKEGMFQKRVIYNSQSLEYRLLILSWDNHSQR